MEYPQPLLQLLLGAEIVCVATLPLAAIRGTWMQPCVAPVVRNIKFESDLRGFQVTCRFVMTYLNEISIILGLMLVTKVQVKVI